MSNRKTIIFLLIGVFALGLANFLLSIHGVGSAIVARTTLLGADSEKAVSIRITREFGPETEFVKDLCWSIEKPFRSDADESRILKLLDGLCLSPVLDSFNEQELAKFDRTREDYGLDSPFLTVSVKSEGTERSVSFGVKTPTGDGVFAAVSNDPAVYIVGTNVLAAINLPPDAFRKRSLVSSVFATVDSFDLKRSKGDFSRFAKKDGSWMMSRPSDEEMQDASSAKTESFLAKILSTEAISFVWPVGSEGESPMATSPLLAGYGLDPDNAVAVTLHSPGRPDEQIAFGNDTKNGFVYALIQNGRAIATVDRELKDLASESDFADTHLFPFARDKVSRISIADGRISYILARDDSGIWCFDSPVNVTCDSKMADRLMDRILDLEPDALANNGVDVSVGASPKKTVSRQAVFPDFTIEDVRSRTILEIPPENIRRLTISTAGETKPVSVLYDPDKRTWNVESPARGMTAIQYSIDGMLSALSSLKADKIVKLKASSNDLRRYGLEKPKFVISADISGSIRRNLMIGEKSQGGHFAALGSLDSVFVLPDKTVRRLTAPLATE